MKWMLAAALAAVAAMLAISLLHASSPASAKPFDLGTRTATSTPQATRTPIGPTPTPAPPRPPTPAALGPGIMVTQCLGTTPDSVRAIFLWAPSKTGAQFLDLSIYNNGFAQGTFIGAGAFAPSAYGFIWDGLRQGATHFARVNTYTSAGWYPSETLSFYTPVCDPGALANPPAADMRALRDRIAEAIAGDDINTAVAITDLRTAETIDIAGDDPRLPGCTINLFGLMRVVIDLQAGKYPEPEAGDLIGQTINRSDPITARRLMRDWVGDGDLLRGMARVNDFMHALGMSDTTMDHPPAFPEESTANDDSANNRITARDANRGLQALWDGRVLSPYWRDYLLLKMTLVKPGLNYLIAAGAGEGSIVSHKNGFLYEEGWADNDIGIVWYDRNGERYAYAISFFTENVPAKYDDIPLGQRIASLAYDWFVTRYGYPVVGG